MTQTAADQTRTGQPVRWRGVAVFVLVPYASIWLVTLPLWFSGRGLATPGAPLLLVAGMFTPALASFVVCRWVERRPWTRTVGLRGAEPGPHRARRTVAALVLPALIVPSVLIVATVLGGLTGIVDLDLTGLSGVRAFLATLPIPVGVLPPQLFLLIQLVQALIASVTINAGVALGEEAGWRGYLLAALLPLGRLPALLLVGTIWAVWHLPLILLGYEYPGAPRGLALLAFVVFCVAAGALLSWFRLRSGSILPAAVGHGAINAWAGLPVLLLAAGAPDRPLLTAPAGLLASACLALLAGLLWLRKPPALTKLVEDDSDFSR